MDSVFVTLFLGLLLGIKHAFEADHLIAVTTMVTEHKNAFKAALVGTFWGIGHTTTLFLIGLFVLLFKITIPEDLGVLLESLVGIMLVVLGIKAVMGSREAIHEHHHQHEGKEHTHLHEHEAGRMNLHQHRRSFLVGALHGVAGSGTLMILILSTMRSVIGGVLYILLFGLGSIAGMTLMSGALGLPIVLSTKKFARMEKYLKVAAGSASILFGGRLIWLGLSPA